MEPLSTQLYTVFATNHNLQGNNILTTTHTTSSAWTHVACTQVTYLFGNWNNLLNSHFEIYVIYNYTTKYVFKGISVIVLQYFGVKIDLYQM